MRCALPREGKTVQTDVQFSVLGPVRLHRQDADTGAGQPRQCAVLTSLLLRAGGPVSLDTLVEDVWGDDAPVSAIGSIRTYIYRLRQALGEDSDSTLKLIDGGYSLHIRPDALDLNRFKQAAAKAREARLNRDLLSATTQLSKALGMWRGIALAGVPGPFAETQRRVLDQLRLACMEDHLACRVEQGHYAEAAAELSALLVEYPLRERLCELLMIALYGAGRQSEALTLYHTTAHRLRQRLGINPSPPLQKIHERILSGQLALPHIAGHDTKRQQSQPQPSATPAQLSPALPRLIGRETEHEQVEHLVCNAAASHTVAICVVGGMAGVGKTAFATTTAHRLIHHFPDGQFFADLQGVGAEGLPRDPTDVLDGFLQSLGVRANDIPATRQARGLMFRGLLANRRILVVLDNANDTEQLGELVPSTAGCMALVTSRVQLHSFVAAYQATPLTLLPLSQADARSFLACRLGASRIAAEPAAVDRIIQLAGHLPLALSNLAARAAFRPQLRLEILANEYALAGQSVLDAFSNEEDSAFDVRTSIMRSYRILDTEPARFFRGLSANRALTFSAPQVANLTKQTEQQVRQNLLHLIRVHLVSEVGPGRYNWNSLVAAFASEQANISP
ncbi:BTAD domain-containing putative transcriptional regulator [Streptomyces sp. NPDC004096]